MRLKSLPALIAVLFAAFLYSFVPHIVQAQFAGQGTYGGTSGGTANAQTITIGNYTGALPGVTWTFLAGATNTGPATINISGTGNVAILRQSSQGPVALSGAEITSGELVSITPLGSSYLMTSNVDMTPIGKTVEFRGDSTPRGVLIEDGSCVSRTTFAPLFAVIGTTYGACDGSTTFGVPDSRGTTFMALDGQGVNGLANRITSASCANSNTNGTLCGSQNKVIANSNLPASIPYTDPGHSHTVYGQLQSTIGYPGGNWVQGTSGNANFNTASSVTNITINPGSANTALAVLNPTLLGRRGIKY